MMNDRLHVTIRIVGILVVSGVLTGAALVLPEVLERGARNSLPLGTINMDGGSEGVDATTVAIPINESGGADVVGTLHNALKPAQNVTAVSIKIVATSPSNSNPPRIGGATVSRGGQSVSGTNSVAGSSITINLTGLPGGGIPAAEDASISIDMVANSGSPASDVNKIWITPSIGSQGQMAEADTYGCFDLAVGGRTKTETNAVHAHGAVAASVHNVAGAGDGSAPIIRLDGAVTFEGGSNSISAVKLLDQNNGFAVVSGSTATITSGTNFYVTGFTLESGSNYVIQVTFSSVPQKSTSLELVATFDP